MSAAAAEPLTTTGKPGVRITSADVGHRVVIRRRLRGQAGPTGGQAYTDVLGILERWDETSLRVRLFDNTIVEIMTADLTRAKRIPPPPARQNPPARA